MHVVGDFYFVSPSAPTWIIAHIFIIIYVLSPSGFFGTQRQQLHIAVFPNIAYFLPVPCCRTVNCWVKGKTQRKKRQPSAGHII